METRALSFLGPSSPWETHDPWRRNRRDPNSHLSPATLPGRCQECWLPSVAVVMTFLWLFSCAFSQSRVFETPTPPFVFCCNISEKQKSEFQIALSSIIIIITIIAMAFRDDQG